MLLLNSRCVMALIPGNALIFNITSLNNIVAPGWFICFINYHKKNILMVFLSSGCSNL